MGKLRPQLSWGHLGKLQKSSAAVALLESFQASRGDVNVIHYNAAISACANDSNWSQALHVFQKVSEAGLVDVVSYGALIHAFSKAACWKEALQVLKNAFQQHLQVNSIMFTSSIAGQNWQTALDLVLQMKQLALDAQLASPIGISCY